jgi:hypothetical protein
METAGDRPPGREEPAFRALLGSSSSLGEEPREVQRDYLRVLRR